MSKEEQYELEAPLNFGPAECKVRKRTRQDVPIWGALLIIAGLVTLFVGAYVLFFRLPRGLLVMNEDKHPASFIAERAAWHIENLTSIGDRVAGSLNNEVHTVNYLLHTIDKIRLGAHPSNLIEVDHQVANGSYWRDKPVYPHLNVYRGIQNVVVRLGRRDKPDTDHYILLNSHFDTVSMSPGNKWNATRRTKGP